MRPTGDVLLYMGEVGAPSWIIDTDYESFAASYSCEEGPLGHYKTATITTRDPSAPQEAVDKAFDAFARNGIELSTLRIASMTMTKTDGARMFDAKISNLKI